MRHYIQYMLTFETSLLLPRFRFKQNLSGSQSSLADRLDVDSHKISQRHKNEETFQLFEFSGSEDETLLLHRTHDGKEGSRPVGNVRSTSGKHIVRRLPNMSAICFIKYTIKYIRGLNIYQT